MTNEFKVLQHDIREFILDSVYKGQSSHVGSSLSCVDILIAQMTFLSSHHRYDTLSAIKNIIVSKGHAAAALYGLIKQVTKNNEIQPDKYYQDNSWLTGHVSHKVNGISHSTGSLGHGLSVAAGMGFQNKQDFYSVLLSDGELQEGSNWEALMVMPNLKINNVSVIIDYNNQQSFCSVSDTMNIEPLKSKLESFGWAVSDCDGHNIEEIYKLLVKDNDETKPKIIIANTIKGKGVSFMENKTEWHYNSPDEQQLKKAKREIAEKYK